MALSFAESLKAKNSNIEQTSKNDVNLIDIQMDDESNLKPILQQSDNNWVRNNTYLWYAEYSDDKYSYVDKDKNITVDPTQINLSQEENSQFIPFEIPRYYDGIDLKDKIIQIHYTNSDGDEDFDNVVNVQYNNDKIRFAWLIDASVTYLPGEITFEIRATGVNEKGNNYTWITRPNGKLNIISSLSGKGIIKPDSDWYTGFVNTMNSKINEASAYAEQANAAATRAENAANGVETDIADMMNGKKKYQRRQFERDQEIYMATKFVGTTATSDQIMFRCNTPVSAAVQPDYTLHLTPYSNMYIDVMFGNSAVKQVRAKAGQTYDINCPYSTMDDTAVLVYAASRIQSMGDISTCYIHDNDFSKAERLKELIVGNTTEGYSNTFLTNLVIGNNKLLEKLDIRNTPNLSTSLDFSKCLNLKELYATGSGLTGVLFANGGKIAIALLPNTLTSINMKNLFYLNNLQIAGYDKISTMIIENCDVVDCKALIEKSKNITRVRITGVDWQLDDTSLLDRIYGMKGIDRNGYNTDQSVLAGSVHVPIMREKKLAEYRAAWSDLDITYNTLVEQFTILFKNDDGTILDTQYVDKCSTPIDPITRDEN